ncbi:peptidoglycan editing factor PgeF [Terriglobus sp. TAA 43]|uniref:peptidoglycan editing factor PgeF n=1 Tax=Terriglobus sp. TAA 43 TaxID=278961 RepID=UPI000A802EA2|nr:peptidoglycan editing factor PgeF [Terriglobus sp. TAA 43]
MTAARKKPAATKKPTAEYLESPEAIAVVDDILGAIGLTHGTRATRRNTWNEGARRLVGKKADLAQKAAVTPKENPKPLFAENLSAAESLVHGFSTRTGGVTRVYRPHLPKILGDLNLGFTAHDEPEDVRTNRTRYLKSIKASRFHSFGMLHQIHSPIVRTIASSTEATGDFLAPAQHKADAMLTDVPGVLLTVQIADCVPVLVFDPKRRAIGAFHAGWRGTLARIVERGIGTMRRQYGSDPADLIAAIGPSIGPSSYSVSEDIRYEFSSQFAYVDTLFKDVYDLGPIREKYPNLFLTARAPGHSPLGPLLHLNLWEANRRQLMDAGLQEKNISVLEEDTAADTGRFFSHRAEDGFTGRMMASIGMSK